MVETEEIDFAEDAYVDEVVGEVEVGGSDLDVFVFGKWCGLRRDGEWAIDVEAAAVVGTADACVAEHGTHGDAVGEDVSSDECGRWSGVFELLRWVEVAEVVADASEETEFESVLRREW